MKHKNLKNAFVVLICVALFSACKKDEKIAGSKDSIETKDYIYNLAKKTISPDAKVTANVTSEVPLKYIYSYLIRDGKGDSLINISYPNDHEPYSCEVIFDAAIFSKADMSGVSGIKNVSKRVDNSSAETFIKLTAFQPPLPVLSGFPESKLPDDKQELIITGKVASESGIKKVEILDDSDGTFKIVKTFDNLNNIKSYDVNYTYVYRPNTANLKIIAYDVYDISVEALIKVPALPYTQYKDVVMSAQGSASITVTNNHIFVKDATTAGSCELNADQEKVDFVLYGSGTSGLQFYNPQNSANIAKNFKCGSDVWTINDISKLKNTRFRILTTGEATTDALYAKFIANEIPDLKSDGFFDGIAAPTGNTAKFLTGTSGTFDASTNYLIWIQIDGTTNCLMRVKEVVFDSGNAGFATVKFDLYVQK